MLIYTDFSPIVLCNQLPPVFNFGSWFESGDHYIDFEQQYE